LTELRSYVLLASYPAIVMFVFDWFSPDTRWAMKNRSRPIPESFKQRGESRGRVLLVFKYFLLLIVTAWLAGGFKRLSTSVVSHRLGFWTYVAGILAGLFTLTFRRVAASAPSISQFEAEDYSLRGTMSIWLAIFAIGAIAEESWRALCIGSFHAGPRFGNVAAAACFALAHMGGLPPRMTRGLSVAAVEVLVGLIFGATFMATGNVFSPFLASVVYYTSNYFWIRRRYLSAGVSPD
jgi:Type II CAAX prenyl endopeptidase Rce1-like